MFHLYKHRCVWRITRWGVGAGCARARARAWLSRCSAHGPLRVWPSAGPLVQVRVSIQSSSEGALGLVPCPGHWEQCRCECRDARTCEYMFSGFAGEYPEEGLLGLKAVLTCIFLTASAAEHPSYVCWPRVIVGQVSRSSARLLTIFTVKSHEFFAYVGCVWPLPGGVTCSALL